MPNFDDTMETEKTKPVAQRDQNHRDARKAIEEARTASLSLYVIGDRSDYTPLRVSGRRFALSGGIVFSTNERKHAQEIADKMNAHYRANKIERHVEVIETLVWRARRVERLVELLASGEL
jgi:hypothetical protein